MIPLAAGLVLFLCVQYVPLAEGGCKCQQCKDLRQGYNDYYACVAQCYQSTFQLPYVKGNLCSGKPKTPYNWDYVEFKYVQKSLECITVQCRFALPPSVCTKESNDYRRTQNANSYDSSASKKGGRNDRYPPSEDSVNYFYGDGVDKTGTSIASSTYADISDSSMDASTPVFENTDYQSEESSDVVSTASSDYAGNSWDDNLSAFTTSSNYADNSWDDSWSSSTPTSMRRNKTPRQGNISKGNGNSSPGGNLNDDYYPTDDYESDYYPDDDYGDYFPDDDSDDDYEDDDYGYYYEDDEDGDNGKGPQDKKEGKVEVRKTTSGKIKSNNGKKGSSEDAEKKLVLAMEKSMDKGKKQPQAGETTSTPTISSKPSSTDSIESTDSSSSIESTDSSSSTENTDSSSSTESTDYDNSSLPPTDGYTNINALGTSSDSNSNADSTYVTESSGISTDGASDLSDYYAFGDYYGYYDDYPSLPSSSSVSYYSTESTASRKKKQPSPQKVAGSGKSSDYEAGAPKNLDKTGKPQPSGMQNKQGGSSSAQYPTYYKGNVANNDYYYNRNFRRYDKYGQYDYGQRGGQVAKGNAGNDYRYYYQDNFQGAAAPGSYSYQWQDNQRIKNNPYSFNPSPYYDAGEQGGPDGSQWGSKAPGEQPVTPDRVIWSNGRPTYWFSGNRWNRRRPGGYRRRGSESSGAAFSRAISRNRPSGGQTYTYSMSDSRSGSSGEQGNAYSVSDSRDGQAYSYSLSQSASGPSGGQAAAGSLANSGGNYPRKKYLTNSKRPRDRYSKRYLTNSRRSNSKRQETKRQETRNNVKINLFDGKEVDVGFKNIKDVQVWDGARLISDITPNYK